MGKLSLIAENKSKKEKNIRKRIREMYVRVRKPKS